MNRARIRLYYATVAAAAGLLLPGCSNGEGGFSTSPESSTAPPALTGTVGTLKVYLENPETHVIPPELQEQLTFTGLDDNGQITIQPVQPPPAGIITLENVPKETTQLLIQGPAGFDFQPVHVDADDLSFVSDVTLLDERATPALESLGVSPKTSDGHPIPLGAGFVQSKPSSVGVPGANAVMSGFEAFSATRDLPQPYRTNTWVTPLLGADNATKMYLGGKPGSDKVEYGPIRVVEQCPIYAHPWGMWYRFDPKVPADRNQGLLLVPEDVQVTPGYEWVGPLGEGDNKPRSGKKAAEFQAPIDVGYQALTLDPGYLATRMKVMAISDLHMKAVIRALDDPDSDKKQIREDASVEMSLLRGSPFAYFRSFGLTKLNLIANLTSGGLTTKSGTSVVGGQTINWYAQTGKFNRGNRELTLVLFIPAAQGSMTPSGGVDNPITITNPDAPTFFAECFLPDGTWVDQATMDKLAVSAFSFPTGSTVTSMYNAATQTVDETLQVTTASQLGPGSPNQPVMGLLPHHYNLSRVQPGTPVLQGAPPELKNTGGASMVFNSVRGFLKVYQVGSVTCRFPYCGVLPYLPPLEAGDNDGKQKLEDWKKVFVARHGADHPPYLNYSGVKTQNGFVGVGQDAYNMAKFVARDASAANTIGDAIGDQALADQVRKAAANGIEIYFRQNPTLIEQQDIGQAPYYFLYDPRVHSLNQYPSQAGGPSVLFPNIDNAPVWDGFGTITRLNDHHFHYGYFIYAAAQVALRDPAWGAKWKDAINQLVFDCANDPKVNPNPLLEFPNMRNWDPYENHSIAAGFNWDVKIGQNQESMSEEMNFWTGVILWAGATGQDALLEHAIKHYAMAAYSSWVYWFDPDNDYAAFAAKNNGPANLNWPGSGSVRLFDAMSRWDTFFGSHPIQCRGIEMIPVTTGSFYHAMRAGHAKLVGDQYQTFVTDLNIDPQKPQGQEKFSVSNQWIGVCLFQAHLAKYYALSSPDDAIAKFYDVPANTVVVGGIVPSDKWTDVGDSGVFTYHFIRYMQRFGTPDPSITSNCPFSMTFFNQTTKKRTYVAFNHTAAVKTVTFSDGQTVNNIPARSLGTKTVP